MGRYVTGDWDWKFAFADLNDVYVNRYVGTRGQGEKVELEFNSIKGIEEFKNKIKIFIKGFKPLKEDSKKRYGSDYWDKVMIKKFLEDKNNEWSVNETYYYYVEY